MACLEGFEPPYSNYIVNDRLEGGDDTGSYLFTDNQLGLRAARRESRAN